LRVEIPKKQLPVEATARIDDGADLREFLAEDIGEAASVLLKGHDKKATLVRWNPVAEHVLLSVAFDNTARVWDASTGAESYSVSFDDTPQHVAWAYNGSAFAVASKDKKINLCDPRANGVSAKFDGHLGAKGARVCFLGKTNMLASTGFSRQSDRQLVNFKRQLPFNLLHELTIVFTFENF
jgi:WD40 repeat protein